jgi:hypothetical protein
LISSTRVLEKTIGADHPWGKNVKYKEANSIPDSLVDS